MGAPHCSNFLRVELEKVNKHSNKYARTNVSIVYCLRQLLERCKTFETDTNKCFNKYVML